MHDRGVHGQPLWKGVLARNHHIDVIPAPQAVIKNRQQAVGVGRKVDAHNISLLVDDVVEEPGVLVRKSVVILLPDVRGEQIVQRRDIPAPWQFPAYLQPLGVLAKHRIDDSNESFITVEEPVSSGQKISFQPTLALVLAEHRVQHPAAGCEEFIVLYYTGLPLAAGDLKYCAQQIRNCLVGTEDTKITLLLIQFGDIAQERTQHERILAVHRAG